MNDTPINGHNHDDASDAPELPMVVLEEMYKPALMGHTVSHDRRPRFCYSLSKLTKIEKARAHGLVTDDTARLAVWTNIVMRVSAAHGDNAPVFIDDAAFAQDDGPKIIHPFRRN